MSEKEVKKAENVGEIEEGKIVINKNSEAREESSYVVSVDDPVGYKERELSPSAKGKELAIIPLRHGGRIDC